MGGKAGCGGAASEVAVVRARALVGGSGFLQDPFKLLPSSPPPHPHPHQIVQVLVGAAGDQRRERVAERARDGAARAAARQVGRAHADRGVALAGRGRRGRRRAGG
jgi:hypothetical protein